MGQSPTDTELIDASVNGGVDAFTALVERYQSLVCAVSYSATGDRALSEDVAQDTFVAAWKGLSELREPSKLRGWLCGIARNLSSKALRRVGREIPTDVEVQAALNDATASPSPLDNALDKESEQLVWSALQDVPETYREPLVLFYREDQSTKQVADALGLTENAVQQRLSRGRQHLKASVASLVERTLEQTKPSKGFALGVVAAITVGAGAGEAAAAGSGGASAKGAAGLVIAGGLLSMKTFKAGAVVVILILLAVGGMSVMGKSGTSASGGKEAMTDAEKLAALHKNRSARPPAVGSRPAKARGRVIDSQTGAGIPGARVVFTDTDLDAGAGKQPGRLPRPITVIADADGRWQMAAVPFGEYLLSATADGFVPGVRRDVSLAPGRETAGLEIALARGGERLEGTVRDVGGGGVPGALVSAIRLDQGSLLDVRRPSFSAATNDQGRYRLSLERGTYVVLVNHEDYVTATRTIDIQATAKVQDFSLAPGGMIEGQVVAKGSETPIPGAFVTMRGGNGEESSMSLSAAIANEFNLKAVVTDADGRFQFAGVRSGAVELRARASGHTSVQATEVELAIAEQLDNVKLWVDTASTVSGFVVAEEDGRPIAGAMVIVSELRSDANTFAAPKVTGDDGYFEVVGVPPGRYMVTAVARGRQFRMGEGILVSNADIGDLLVKLSKGATLTGRVDPGVRATVGLRTDNMIAAMAAVFVSADTDDDGRFVLEGAPAGNFELVARTRDGRGGTLEVALNGTDQSGLLVPLDDQASIRGRVVDDSGAPLAGHRVRVSHQGTAGGLSLADLNGGAQVWTDTNGNFAAIGLEDGTYQVSAHGTDAPDAADSPAGMLPFVGSADRPWLPQMFKLSAGEKKQGVVLTVKRSTSTLDGRVVDASGAPVADAWVVAQWIPGDGSLEAWWGGDGEGPVLTDRDGHFRFEGLRQGGYRLTANQARNSGRGRIEAKTGESVTLRLQSLGAVSGTVTRNGEPVKQFKVRVTGPTARERTIASDRGEFVLERLDPGRYTISITADAGTSVRSVEVTSERPTRVGIELQPWATVSGRVLSRDTGKPVPGVFVLVFGEAGETFADMLGNVATNTNTKSGADGRFTVPRVAVGRGMVSFMDSEGFRGGDILGSRLFTAGSGQQGDLGDIMLLSAPEQLEKAQRGFIGLFAGPAVWDSEGPAAEASQAKPSLDPKDRVLKVMSVGHQQAIDAGIEEGDEITAINGMSIDEVGPTAASMLLEYGRVAIGQTFELQLRRGGKSFSVTLTAVKLPPEIEDMMP